MLALGKWFSRRRAQSPEPAIELAKWENEPAEKLSTPATIVQRVGRLPEVLYRDMLGEQASRQCPVLLPDGTVAILAVEGHAYTDQTSLLLEHIVREGRRLAKPARYIVPPGVIVSILKGQPLAGDMGGRNSEVASQNQLSQIFHDLVKTAVEQNASDIHINLYKNRETSEVRFTIAGRYIELDRFKNLSTDLLRAVVGRAYQDILGAKGATFDEGTEQQGRLEHEVAGRRYMLRWASMAADRGASVTLRVLEMDAKLRPTTLPELGYLPYQVELFDRARLSEGGAIVMAGVVGSGKSTTQAVLLSMLPAHRKLITFEDPVEYLIPNAIQNTIVRDLATDLDDAQEFAAKLRTAKRSAMTDLLIGEIRDPQTGKAFMDLVGSGTNVYTTTHAPSALLIPDRLASDFIRVSRDFMATPGVLKLLVYQALLPRLCPHCALPFRTLMQDGGKTMLGRLEGPLYWTTYGKRLERLYDLDLNELRITNPEGCAYCRTNGIPELYGTAGRTVVAEMFEPGLTDDFLQAIRTGDTIGLRRMFRELRTAPYTSPDMHGKTAMECAIYKASCGQLDVREIEPRFQSFETVERQRLAERPVTAEVKARKATTAARSKQVADVQT